MTDTQVITVVLSIVLSSAVSFLGMVIGNSRVGDVKEVLRAEIKASTAELRSEIDKLRMTVERMDDNIARLLADLDRRVTKLETEKA